MKSREEPKPLTEDEKSWLKRIYGEGTSEFDFHQRCCIEVLKLLALRFPFPLLRPVFRELIYFEWLSHIKLDRKRYRDHIGHPLKVALQGHFIIEELQLWDAIAEIIRNRPPRNTKLHHYFSEISDFNKTAKLAWWIASLFHDVGMPFDPLLQFHRKISESYGSLLPPLKFPRSGKPSYLKDLPRDGKNLHAHFGARLLNSSISDDYPPEYNVALYIAALAIDSHHKVEPIYFDREPITFMLYLSDNTQEWGRVFIAHHCENDEVRVGFYQECISIIIECRDGKLIFEYEPHRDISISSSFTKWKDEEFRKGKERLLDHIIGEGIFPKIIFTGFTFSE